MPRGSVGVQIALDLCAKSKSASRPSPRVEMVALRSSISSSSTSRWQPPVADEDPSDVDAMLLRNADVALTLKEAERQVKAAAASADEGQEAKKRRRLERLKRRSEEAKKRRSEEGAKKA